MANVAAATAQGETFAFPATFAASAKYYFTSKRSAAAEAERNLVQRGLRPAGIPLIDADAGTNAEPVQPSSDGFIARLRRLRLSGTDARRELNFLEISNPDTVRTDHAVVVLHGYGNGLAFWWQNMAAMTMPGLRLFVHDLLGMGRSGRPSFPSIKVKAVAGTPAAIRERVTTAEAFFVDSLEEWRDKEQIERMTIVGHSLGGLLGSAYALRHPDRVTKLILVSPVGIPEAPHEMPSTEDEPNVASLAEAEFASTPAEANRAGKNAVSKPAPPSGWWTSLWERGTSPFSLIRGATVFGPSLISRYAARRFAAFENDVQKSLFEYLYAISVDRGSGEHALYHLLAPGAYARWPLIKRLPALDIPITFAYGDGDWMQPKGGYDTVARLKSKPRTPATELQHRRSKTVINEHSGHWVHLENPAGFNAIIRRELSDALTDLPASAST